MIETNIPKYQEELIKTLQTLVKFKSVKDAPGPNAPYGVEISKTLDAALEIGEKMGFKAVNVDHHAGYIEFGEGKEMLGILCHLDVVPEGTGWSHPPYAGVVVDDRLYGRGTLDDKGPMVACLYAMKILKDSGFTPQKRIRLILGTDEESGSNCMKYYLEKAEKPTVAFSPDADFPVIHGEMGIVLAEFTKEFGPQDEDGGIKVLEIKGGTAPNMVPELATASVVSPFDLSEIVALYDKADLVLTQEGSVSHIKCHGVSAHGSTPEKGVNAISQLIQFLSILDLQIGDTSDFIRYIAERIGTETDGESLGIAHKDYFNALVSNLGMLHITENSGKMVLNIRYPITYKERKLKKAIDSAIRGTGIELTNWHCAPPLFFKPDHPLVKTLMTVYKTCTGDENAKPITIGGGTYARTMPNAVAFGALFPGQEDTMHQKNEYIRIPDLMKITEIYTQAIYELSK